MNLYLLNAFIEANTFVLALEESKIVGNTDFGLNKIVSHSLQYSTIHGFTVIGTRSCKRLKIEHLRPTMTALTLLRAGICWHASFRQLDNLNIYTETYVQYVF